VWVLYRKRVESARSFFFFSSSIRNWVDDELSAADCKEKRSSLDDLKGKGTCPFLLFELGRRSFVRWLGGERTVYTRCPFVVVVVIHSAFKRFPHSLFDI
jgi:hypothetical protein